MQVITDKELYRRIWDKINKDYSFHPSVNSRKKWLKPDDVFQKYKIEKIWDERQEAIVNTILCDVIGEEMYALDWQHDCFLFDPNERIPMGYAHYDSMRDYTLASSLLHHLRTSQMFHAGKLALCLIFSSSHLLYVTTKSSDHFMFSQ